MTASIQKLKNKNNKSRERVKTECFCILPQESVLCSEQKQGFVHFTTSQYALFRAKAQFCAFYYQTVCFVQSKSRTFVHFTTRRCALFRAKAELLCILLQDGVLCSKQKQGFVHFTISQYALFRAKAGFCAFYYNSRQCALFRAKAEFLCILLQAGVLCS